MPTPNYVYAAALLVMDFEGADTSTSFTDLSLIPDTVTAVGNAQVSTAWSATGSSSLLLDGTGDYLTIASPKTQWNDFGGQDWMVDMNIYMNALPGGDAVLFSRWLSAAQRNIWIGVTSGGFLKFQYYTTGASVVDVTGSIAMTTGVKYHIRVLRQQYSVFLFVDGVYDTGIIGTVNNMQLSSGFPVRIGANGSGTEVMSNCYIDSLVVQKFLGSGTGSAGFTPPAALPTGPITVKSHDINSYHVTYATPPEYSTKQVKMRDINENTIPIRTVILGEGTGTGTETPTEAATGIVTNEGIPVSRTIKAFLRSSGLFVSSTVSDPVDGSYTILLIPNEEHVLICYDDSGDPTKNDLIRRRLITVP